MEKSDLKPEELARIRVVFALRRMGQELQSDVLADRAIAKHAGITLSSPVSMPGDVVLERNNLFSAFQKAADGEPIPDILDINGVKRDIKIEVQNDTALATYGLYRTAFPQAALLSKNIEKRQQILAGILKSNTVTREAREKLKSIVNRPDYSHADFFAAREILLGSPESFVFNLREAARKGNALKKDWLPSKTSHWTNLTAKRRSSEKLTEFINGELAEERALRLSEDPKDAIDVISLTFGGPELVPLEAMRAIKSDDLIVGLTHLLELPDPFALAGAFEICADLATTDARLIELGDAILDRLLGDPQKLSRELRTFAATFVVATAYLAEHETLRKEPVFWRRLAAASHASLVTRVLGGSDDDKDSLFAGAMSFSGKTYYLSVLNDAHSEPRWRPDWIGVNHLMADIYGRLQASVYKLGDAVPEIWRKKVEGAQTSMLKDAPPLAQMFPAVLQGWTPAAEKPGEDRDVGQMYADFSREPTLEKFLYFIPLVFAFGFARDAHDAVLSVVQSLRASLATTPAELAQAALDLAALIAAQNRDPELADTVAAVAVEKLVLLQDDDSLLPTVAVILQCAAARTDRKEALSMLARRLENLAFVAPASHLPQALDTFRILQSINAELGVLLGRPIATVRLGLPRVGDA